jgi:16S rRNA (cytosine1402-N4)-methyltransferase
MSETYHIPVLREEVARYLLHKKDGTYVDGTLGGGGHAEYLLTHLSSHARYIGIDQDSDAICFAQKRLSKHHNVIFEQANFKDTHSVLEKFKTQYIDGFFLDLGISSYQLENHRRGFTYMNNGPLDMRMDQRKTTTAEDIINEFPEISLKNIFHDFGEEKYAGPIARQICRARMKQPIKSSKQLCQIIDKIVTRNQAIKSYARIFQAIRIAVNDELTNLDFILNECLSFIRNGGRLVVIAYHSLEDRIVKTFLKNQENPCVCPPEFPHCICGKKPRMKILTGRPVRAQKNEIDQNVRARSALLRAGEIL